MLEFLHAMLLAALGGVRLRDAVEAAAYERLKPAERREDALSPAAHVICMRVDRIVAAARSPG